MAESCDLPIHLLPREELAIERIHRQFEDDQAHTQLRPYPLEAVGSRYHWGLRREL